MGECYLVGSDKVGHGNNFVVILVRLRFLRVKGVDARLHQHVGKHYKEMEYNQHNVSLPSPLFESNYCKRVLR